MSITGKLNRDYLGKLALRKGARFLRHLTDTGEMPLQPGKTSGRLVYNQQGFTLMELIIVSVLAAIFLTLSIPALRHEMLDDELNAATRQIIGTVQEIRNLAVREHKPYLLHFELGERRIWYEAEGASDLFAEEEETALQLPQEVRLEEVRLASQETENSRSVTLWISNKGYMDQMTVLLSDNNNRDISIVFSPFSGSAKIHDNHLQTE
ncbi:MAG: prepilin-type N-terminal cleavage/methylation domain-containing protein [Desulfocapsaceae bacterium]|nr:prepilin-type N-terminal cleavage/methylation domain-containing protein [Desulfocapsaceae bacterium]